MSITDLKGVYSAAVSAGIKAKGLDLAYIFVPHCYAAAGVFTRNRVRAACVEITEQRMRSGTMRGVIINSGNANAVTGARGRQDALRTARIAARLLGVPEDQIGVASTGIIGKKLPFEKIESGLRLLLGDSLARNGVDTGRAILTTDTCAKSVDLQAKIGASRVALSGIAKGSGMIAPNMGTTLSFLVTDARVPRRRLQQLLRDAVDSTFNLASVDTDTSTNDMLLLFSTGEVAIGESPGAIAKFSKLLRAGCDRLARQIIRDGEGATRLIEAVVSGARSEVDARLIAKSIIDSPLVKCAVHGADPNWGRILAAAGKVQGVALDPRKLQLKLQGVCLVRRGMPTDFTRAKLHQLLMTDTVRVELDLGLGRGSATAIGCDLGRGYIDINVAYS